MDQELIENDVWIAALALEHNLDRATRDASEKLRVSDFGAGEGLYVEKVGVGYWFRCWTGYDPSVA